MTRLTLLLPLALLSCTGRAPADADDQVADAGRDAGLLDAGDDDGGPDGGPVDAGDDAGSDGGVLDTRPPPGGRCGRAWDAFDPDEVYVITAFPTTCGVVGFGDPDAFAGSVGCGGNSAIRPRDGRMVLGGGSALYVFAADVADEVEGRCSVIQIPTANDERLPTSACDDDAFIEVADFLLKPDGGYAYRCAAGGWFDGDGRALPGLGDLHVVAFNDVGDALTYTNDEPPTSWSVVRADGRVVPVTGLPTDAAPVASERSTRVAGRSFRVPIVPRSGDPGLYVVDDEGRAEHQHDWVAPANVDPRKIRLGADGSLYVVESGIEDDRVVRLLPGRAGADVVFRAVHARGGSIGSLLTGP